MAKVMFHPHNASVETGTEMNSRNVVKSAEKPIDLFLSRLRLASIIKINAKNGAKMKMAPSVWRKFITLVQPPSINDRMSAKSAIDKATV